MQVKEIWVISEFESAVCRGLFSVFPTYVRVIPIKTTIAGNAIGVPHVCEGDPLQLCYLPSIL